MDTRQRNDFVATIVLGILGSYVVGGLSGGRELIASDIGYVYPESLFHFSRGHHDV